MVAQVQDDNLLAAGRVLREALAGRPLLGLAHVAAAGEEIHVQAAADPLHHADQCFLLDPDLHPEVLLGPLVDPVAGSRGGDDCLGVLPVRIRGQLARAVLDGVPVHVAGQPRLADDVSQALVRPLGVRDQVAGDELVVELAQGQLETLRRVLADDGVGLRDDRQRRPCEALMDELLPAHSAASRSSCGGRKVKRQTSSNVWVSSHLP